VDGLQMVRDPATGCVHLTWLPVLTDLEGRSERVVAEDEAGNISGRKF